jgi:thioredoxin reductase
VVDAGGQSNLAAHGIGGLLGQDGRPPAELYAHGRRELAAYPAVEVRDGSVARGRREDGELVLELADGSIERARRVLLATGMDYRTPPLDGVAERWGRSVFHCPFCHGWEVRDRALAVLDRGETGVSRALLLRMWSDDVTLLSDGPGAVEPADADRLRQAAVALDERAVAGLRGPGAELEAVVFADGSERPCGGLLLPVTLHQRSDLAAQLGATSVARGVSADAIEIDGQQRTTADGVLAAGDVSVLMPSVANAVTAGAMAAAMVVHDLAVE